MMNKIIRRTFTACLLPACIAVTACDSQGTKEVKEQAKAIDQSYEAQADLVEASGKNAPNSAATEAQADALRDKGEAIKDHLINEAKEVQRETPSH